MSTPETKPNPAYKGTGRRPLGEAKCKSVTLRFPPSFYEAVKAAAARDGRSVSGFIQAIVNPELQLT